MPSLGAYDLAQCLDGIISAHKGWQLVTQPLPGIQAVNGWVGLS